MFDRDNPFRGRKPVGSVSQNRPQPPLFAPHLPPAPSYEEGTFQDGRNTEVFMKTAELDQNQLTIKIDQSQNLLFGEMAAVLAGGYERATNSLVL